MNITTKTQTTICSTNTESVFSHGLQGNTFESKIINFMSNTEPYQQKPEYITLNDTTKINIGVPDSNTYDESYIMMEGICGGFTTNISPDIVVSMGTRCDVTVKIGDINIECSAFEYCEFVRLMYNINTDLQDTILISNDGTIKVEVQDENIIIFISSHTLTCTKQEYYYLIQKLIKSTIRMR